MFYTFTLVLRPRNRRATETAMKEFCVHIFNHGGVIRRCSNEGIIRPYKRFRDPNVSDLHNNVRYWSLQCDIGPACFASLNKMFTDHPDVLRHLVLDTEKSQHLKLFEGSFPLDSFTRTEEEIHWPPHVSGAAFDQMDMNWKEFSRNRWSNFLRS